MKKIPHTAQERTQEFLFPEFNARVRDFQKFQKKFFKQAPAKKEHDAKIQALILSRKIKKKLSHCTYEEFLALDLHTLPSGTFCKVVNKMIIEHPEKYQEIKQKVRSIDLSKLKYKKLKNWIVRHVWVRIQNPLKPITPLCKKNKFKRNEWWNFKRKRDAEKSKNSSRRRRGKESNLQTTTLTSLPQQNTNQGETHD